MQPDYVIDPKIETNFGHTFHSYHDYIKKKEYNAKENNLSFVPIPRKLTTHFCVCQI